MNYDFQIDLGDLIPQRYVEPENPFETLHREVGAWHDREEMAWRIAGCPNDFEFQEPYPLRPTEAA